MRHKFWIGITLCTLLSGCSNEDITTPSLEKPRPSVTQQDNINANKATLPEYRRLEMPKIHEGNDTILIHRADGIVNYIVEWDINKKSQRWSCYVLNKTLLEQHTNRYVSDTDQYPFDNLIPLSLQWSKDPYRGNRQGYDHGHICPSADRLFSSTANYQTFFLTNMQPQFSSFNRGVWEKMEKQIRSIALQSDTLYICKGGTIDKGTYEGKNKVYTTLRNGLIVPRFFFMAILKKRQDTYTALGLWIDQVTDGTDTGTQLAKYAISIDELEKRTGIDFFCNLPDEIENKVEKDFGSPFAWGLR